MDPKSYTNIDATVKQAQTAERGGLEFIFLPDRLFMHGNLSTSPSMFNMDPIITLSAVAQATNRIGLMGTASTSFTEPYLLARQLKALDIISHGRAGWNAVPSYEPDAFANFAKALPPREKKYERLHEAMQIVQALWGSWGYEAGEPNQAGMYANVVIGMPSRIEESQAIRHTIREAAAQAGRDPKEIKLYVFASPSVIGTDEQVADYLQEWFEAEAADGFVMNFDDFNTGIGEFVDRVVPILRERDLFHDGYEGKTLRDHLGLPPQYGLDPRIATGSTEETR